MVKTFILVVCRDTTHAKAVYNLVSSVDFYEGAFADKVLQIDSTTRNEELIQQQFVSLENDDNEIEIVIQVNMLKEGWDVTYLYTIAEEQPHVDGRYPYQGVNIWCGRLEAMGRLLFRYRPAAIDEFLSDGQELPFWGGLRVLHLPGHTLGHCGFYSAKYELLFSWRKKIIKDEIVRLKSPLDVRKNGVKSFIVRIGSRMVGMIKAAIRVCRRKFLKSEE